MKKVQIVFCFLWLFPFCIYAQTSDALPPTGLMVDLMEHTDWVWTNGYRTNVSVEDVEKGIEHVSWVEIESKEPSFGWIVNDTRKNIKQTACQILVSSSREKLLKDSADMWNSGITNSDNSVAVKYAGNPLKPNTIYYWKVRTWNNGTHSAYSDIHVFRTANELKDMGLTHYPLQRFDEFPKMKQQVDSVTWFIDFGKAAFGRVRISLLTSKADTLLVHLGEAVKNNRLDRNPGGTIRYRAIKIPVSRGFGTYEIKIPSDKRNTGSAAIKMPSSIGEVMPFRYVEIEGVRNYSRELTVIRESVSYPFDEDAARFTSSSKVLNDIWDFCKYSIKATSFTGMYIDGDRERIPYEADALINQLSHYAVDREFSMARNSLAYLTEHATWPTEWSLQLVLIAWYDYLYTGNDEAVRYFYEILKAKTLMELTGGNGLISTRTGKQTPEFLKSIGFTGKELRDIVDWPQTGILGLGKNEPGETDGYVFTDYNTVVNAFHFKSLLIMAQIAEQMGKKEDATYFRLQSEKVRKAFNAIFFDQKRKIYKDGDGTDHASLHANFFPLAFGLVEPRNYNTVLEFVRSRGMACSVYGAQFLLDALYNASDAAYGFQLLSSTSERSWAHMIYNVGSTISLEAWDNKYKPNQDWNHAWGSAPANVIPRKLIGIEPLEVGFRKFQIKPQPGPLEMAEITLPTIRGEINVSFQNKPGQSFEMQMNIPCNTMADVFLPDLGKKQQLLMDGNRLEFSRESGFLKIKNVGSGAHTFKVFN